MKPDDGEDGAAGGDDRRRVPMRSPIGQAERNDVQQPGREAEAHAGIEEENCDEQQTDTDG